MSGIADPTEAVKERKAVRVHSAEKLVAVSYAPASSYTVNAASLTVELATSATADASIVFVSQSQFKAGAEVVSTLAGASNFKDVATAIEIAEAQGFKGAYKQVCVIPGVSGRVLLVGLGNIIDGHSSARAYLSVNQLRNVVHEAIVKAKGLKVGTVAINMPTLPISSEDSVEIGYGDGVKPLKVEDAPVTPLATPVEQLSVADAITVAARSVILGHHVFDKYYSSEAVKERNHRLTSVTIVTPSTAVVSQQAFADAVNVAESVLLAREVGNDRADVVNPQYMEDVARALVAAHPDVLSIRVLQNDELLANGFNLITAVGQAAVVPPRIVAIEYNSKCDSEWVGLVGKGITYDTGGLNLKPTGFMEEMHMDMCGSAAVLGAMRALAITRPADAGRVVGILALAENSIDAKSYRPYTIIETYVGSVQIGNTDAEGRLALADALTFVQNEYKVKKVVDVATLTGACVIALGEYAAGLFSNSTKFATSLQSAGAQHYERLWRLPILPEHQEEMKGDMSDLSSTGKGRYGGSSTAASFLEKYIHAGVSWCHMDVAGAASYSAPRNNIPKGATGFGVQTLYELVSKK